MQTNETTQAMLARLALHRERMGTVNDLTHTRYSKAENNALTQAVNEYWQDMAAYYEREHDG